MKTQYLAFLLGAALLAGCNDKPAEVASTPTTAPPATDTPPAKDAYDATLSNSQLSSRGIPSQAKPMGKETISVADRKPKDGEEVAVLETDMGKIVLMFFPDKAPNHVANFKKLVKSGFYDGTRFHRTIPNFMIQGGDPNTKNSDRSSWGQGGPEERVMAEFNDIHHTKGVLSMARSNDPNSAGSQFFIMVGEAPTLDWKYSAFGKVVTGQEVADKIVSQPAEGELAVDPVAIKKATLQKWPVK
ncbi:MAG: peptidylprolyl isomerase [Fimbriimonas sp.]